MAYRFTNTDKWNDSWFSDLKQFEKLLFMYLCDNCDIAGFIEININRWSSDLGSSKDTILGAIEGLSRGLIISESKDCIFIRNFLKHQKNLPLNEKNNAHLGIIKKFDYYKNKFNIENIDTFINQCIKPLAWGYGKGNGSGNDKFNFKKSLIDLGVEEKIVNEWILVRKNKKATNSETAFNSLVNQIKLSKLSAKECIKISVENSWAGFKSEWVKNINNKNTQNGNNKRDLSTIDHSTAKRLADM